MYCHASVKGQRPAPKKPTKCKQPQQPPTTTTTTAKRHKRTTTRQNIELLLVNDNSLTSQLTTPTLPSRPPLFNCFSAKKTNYTTPSLFGNRRHYRRNNAMSFRLTTPTFIKKGTNDTPRMDKNKPKQPTQNQQDTQNQQESTPNPQFQTYVVFIFIVFEKLCIDINLLLNFCV